MAKQKWTLRLEFECDQGVDGTTETNIELIGEHDGDSGLRAVNECIAIDMGNLMQMFLASGRVACSTDVNETVEAFRDSMIEDFEG